MPEEPIVNRFNLSWPSLLQVALWGIIGLFVAPIWLGCHGWVFTAMVTFIVAVGQANQLAPALDAECERRSRGQ